MQTSYVLQRLIWVWPWYMLAAASAVIVGNITPPSLRPIELGIFLILALLVMLRERVPEVLLLPVALAVWILARMPWVLWQTMLVGSLLCVLIFASQFIWRMIPPVNLGMPPWLPARILAIGGQVGITLTLFLVYSGSDASFPVLQTGCFALFILILLFLWLAYIQPRAHVRVWTWYTAGLLFAFIISWELRALPNLTVDILLLPPASYLTVVAPFLMRDRSSPRNAPIGQIASIVGAIGLFLPSLILSDVGRGTLGAFPVRLISTLLLLAESLSLFLLGLLMRIRFFSLGGVALVVVGAIESLIYAVTQPQQTGVVLVSLFISAVVLFGGGGLVALRRPKAQP